MNVSLGAVELFSSRGSSVSVLNEHDILTYEWVKAAYSCTHSETCRCVEVRELKTVSYSSSLVLWGSRIKTREGLQIRPGAITVTVLLVV